MPSAPAADPRRVLYLSHDGALDPLGQSQIVPYLLRLSGPDVRMTLLTFEKPRALADRQAVTQLSATLAAARIDWVRLPYHRWPPLLATAMDMLRGFWHAWRIVRRRDVRLIHARSYVPAVLAIVLKRLTGVRVVFDMRELWVDGRVDGGAWKRGGLLHRLGKRCERWCLRQADAIVSLTEAGKGIVEQLPYWNGRRPMIEVIPTCVDVERFGNHREDAEPPPEFLRGRRVIVYAGSVGSWYRMDAVADCYRAAADRWPNALLLILTPQPELACAVCRRQGLADTQYAVRTVAYGDMPRYLRWAEVSLYFIAPSYAKRSSCPTKLGESLAAGLPVLTNRGIGDTDAVIGPHRVGVLVEAFTPDAYRLAWDDMEALLAEGRVLRERCRRVARERFDLGWGAARYRTIYDRVGIS